MPQRATRWRQAFCRRTCQITIAFCSRNKPLLSVAKATNVGTTRRCDRRYKVYGRVLEEWTRERVPLDWAMTQNNLGTALSTLGERESGTARLEEAVNAYRDALQERTRQRASRVKPSWVANSAARASALARASLLTAICWENTSVIRISSAGGIPKFTSRPAETFPVWRFLRARKIDLSGRKSWCESNDPEFVAKAAEIVGLYMAPPENAVVLSVDEKPSIQALERAQGYLKLPTGRALIGQSHDYKRHGTTTLFAALEVATGKVTGRHYKRRRRVEFLDFMNKVVADYPERKST